MSTALDRWETCSQFYCARTANRSPPPPHIHLASTWCHSHDRCSQAFPVFRALLLPCIIYWTQTEEQKTGKAWERDYSCTQVCTLLKSLVTISCIIGYTTLTLVHVASNNWHFGCWASLQVGAETVRQLHISFVHAFIHHRFLSLTCFLYGFPRLLVTTLFSCVRRVSVAEDDPLVAALW